MATKHRIEFDPSNFSIRHAGSQWWTHLKHVLVFLAVTFAMGVVFYLAFSLFMVTRTDRRLRRENKAYAKVYPQLEKQRELLADVITGLQYKDNSIYEQVFHSTAPNVDPMSSLNSSFASDTIPESRLSSYTMHKAEGLQERARDIDAAFLKIAEQLVNCPSSLPPMLLPVKDISYPQVGASVGDRYNPFYKAVVRHTGMDFITPAGTEVYASAAGEVVESRSLTGTMGTVVKIRHDGGYETFYAHLGTRYVNKGQKVQAGQRIGTVGMTGNAYAPHLHYEVYLNGVLADPVNYFFASVTPEEYANILYMSANTMQSMD